MKALTLWNPWATLLAIGEKRIETRSWRTPYRGPVAIHASARKPNWPLIRQLGGETEARDVLRAHGFKTDADLTRGAVIATCELVDVVPIEQARLEITQGIGLPLCDPAEFELKFGDYAPGRWGFLLAHVVRLETPIPAKGLLKLWNWEPAVPPEHDNDRCDVALSEGPTERACSFCRATWGAWA